MDESLKMLVDLFSMAVSSKMGTAIAAVVLAVLVYLLQKVPFVKDLLAKSEAASRVAMVFLAVAPAVVVSLSSKASWMDAALTAVLTLLGALGAEKVAGYMSSKA